MVRGKEGSGRRKERRGKRDKERDGGKEKRCKKQERVRHGVRD